jgi:hypothetical protein
MPSSYVVSMPPMTLSLGSMSDELVCVGALTLQFVRLQVSSVVGGQPNEPRVSLTQRSAAPAAFVRASLMNEVLR